MNSNEFGFVIFLIIVVIICIAVKIVKVSIMFQRNKKDRMKTHHFYDEVAEQVNKDKKKEK